MSGAPEPFGAWLPTHFPLGEGRLRWGTTLDELRALAAQRYSAEQTPRLFHGHAITFPCAEVLGVPVQSVTARAFGDELPVYQLRFDLPDDPSFAGPSALERLRGPFDAQLQLQPPRATRFSEAMWTSGPATLGLAIRAKPQTYSAQLAAGGYTETTTAGTLTVSHDQRALAKPLLEAKTNDGPPWTRSPGVAELMTVPGLREAQDPSLLSMLLGDPDVHPTPEWLAEQLPPGVVAVWTHPEGWWGLADQHRASGWPTNSQPQLQAEVVTPGRNAGECRVHFLEARGGPDLLDPVRRRLADLGATFRTTTRASDL